MATFTSAKTKKGLLNRPQKPYVHPYFGGMVLGIILFLALLLTGNGLGSSGATSRIDAAVVDAVTPSHVDKTPYLLKWIQFFAFRFLEGMLCAFEDALQVEFSLLNGVIEESIRARNVLSDLAGGHVIEQGQGSVDRQDGSHDIMHGDHTSEGKCAEQVRAVDDQTR